jgi:hypothetical protein
MTSLSRRLERRLFKAVRIMVMKTRRMFLFMRRRAGEMERWT